ncbi:hypothetical protein AB5N19_06063 [Seiridium cardinale]
MDGIDPQRQRILVQVCNFGEISPQEASYLSNGPALDIDELGQHLRGLQSIENKHVLQRLTLLATRINLLREAVNHQKWSSPTQITARGAVATSKDPVAGQYLWIRPMMGEQVNFGLDETLLAALINFTTGLGRDAYDIGSVMGNAWELGWSPDANELWIEEEVPVLGVKANIME